MIGMGVASGYREDKGGCSLLLQVVAAGDGDKDDDENVLVVKFLAFLDVISSRPLQRPTFQGIGKMLRIA